MKKISFVFTLLLAVMAIVMYANNTKAKSSTLYFRYSANDINFNSLKNPTEWQPISLPATECDNGEHPCVVSVDDLIDYGGIYSPGVIDEVDFARFLELKGSAPAQTYVTGDNMLAGREVQ